MRIACKVNNQTVDGTVKVQYLRYARFLRISCIAKHAAFFEIAQALILNFPGSSFFVPPISQGAYGFPFCKNTAAAG
jgi:hypothetical protein